jgi:hypothetical protein
VRAVATDHDIARRILDAIPSAARAPPADDSSVIDELEPHRRHDRAFRVEVLPRLRERRRARLRSRAPAPGRADPRRRPDGGGGSVVSGIAPSAEWQEMMTATLGIAENR